MLSTEMMTELRSPNEWIGNHNDTENFVPMFRVRNVSGFERFASAAPDGVEGAFFLSPREAPLQFHWSFFFGFLEIPEIRRCCEVERDLGGSGEELVNELHVADVVLLISDNAEELAELGGLVLLELLAEGAENVLDLGEGDLAGTLLVEDLQALNVILLDSGGGEIALDGGEDGAEVGEGDALLAQLLGATMLGDLGVGHVAAQSAQDVAQVESVDIIALVGLVKDDESVLGLRHFGCWSIFLQKLQRINSVK